MVQINGKINASINGLIRFTPDHVFRDTSTTPATIVSYPIEAPIVNGSFSITVPQSEDLASNGVSTEGVTYKVEVLRSVTTTTYFFLDGGVYSGRTHLHTDGIYYTGSVHSANSTQLDRVDTTTYTEIQEPFHAIAPNSSTAVDFGLLLGVIVQKPYENISLYTLAEMLTTIEEYRRKISSNLNIKGAYNADTFYVVGDLVSFNGNGYIWRNAASLKGQTPPMTGDNANWFMLVAKGATGGTGAQIVGYNPATWAGSAEAAARGDVRDAIASLAPPDLSNYLTKAEGAPRNNAVFTGSTKRAQLSYATLEEAQKATEIPTAKYVEDAVLALISTGKLPSPLIYATRQAQLTISTSVYTVIPWDARTINAGNILATNGDITMPENGNYLIHTNLLFESAGNIGANNTRTIFDVAVSKFANNTFTDVGGIIYDNEASTAGAWRSRRQGWRLVNGVVAGELYSIRAKLGGGGVDASGNSISPGGNAGQANYFAMWKVA